MIPHWNSKTVSSLKWNISMKTFYYKLGNSKWFSKRSLHYNKDTYIFGNSYLCSNNRSAKITIWATTPCIGIIWFKLWALSSFRKHVKMFDFTKEKTYHIQSHPKNTKKKPKLLCLQNYSSDILIFLKSLSLETKVLPYPPLLSLFQKTIHRWRNHLRT